MSEPRGRFVVGTIPPEEHVLFSDIGVEQGDEIIALDGFPANSADKAPAVEHRRVRVLHPAHARQILESGALRRPAI